jgi:hypothetical protein
MRLRLVATHPASLGVPSLSRAERAGNAVWQLPAGGIPVAGALQTGEPSVLITCHRSGW